MIHSLVELSVKNRLIVLLLYVSLAGWGWWALRHTPIDAIPDLSDNQVIVFTDWPGHSPREVEDQVTYPLTTTLQGLAGVRAVRSQSAFGFSMISVLFEDNVELYFARSRVLERMSLVTRTLPSGATATLGPDATGVGHVFWYTVESRTHSLRDLRSLQDWFIRYQLTAVPGVAEVASVGGLVQQYQIDVNPDRLRTYGLPLSAVVAAVRESNVNVGGNVIESSGAWLIVRGVGLITSVHDVEQIVVGASGGVPIYVSQVADVHIGDAFRVASLVKGTSEAVGGVVVARTGVNTKELIDRIKARIAEISPGLPSGVSIVPFYDRSRLIEQAAGTLRRALIEEIVLVTLAHVVFLMHLRSILIVTLPLPLAVLTAFLGMYYAGVSSNIMSLAGIAIAIGVLVDAGIVVTENAFRSLEQGGIDTTDRPRVWHTVLAATHMVARPVFFSMAIVLLAFVPVFALTGQEGKLFHPLALTKTIAVLAATVIAITLVPVLCTYLLRGTLHPEEANPVMRSLRRLYRPVLEWALAARAWALGAAAVLFVGALVLARGIGSEFMPPLNEGDLLFMPIADPSISLEENTKIAARQNAALLAFPEVAQVVAKVGRAETSTDPAPLNMTETIVQLKPPEAWRPGMTLERLRAEMSRAVQLPGVSSIWTMPIINRIDMLTTGVRSEVGVKLYGSDLDVLEGLAARVAETLRRVPGAANVYPERVSSGQYLNIEIDRTAAARHGIRVGDVSQVIETAIGETTLTTTIEGRRRFPVRVRYAPAYRTRSRSPRRTCSSPLPRARRFRSRQLARIEHARGPAMISSENGLLLATVLMNVQGRDPGGFVADAQAAVAREVRLPAGYYVGWSGRWENQVRARERLQSRPARRAGRHLRAAVLHVPLGARSRARAPGGALRAHRRRLSALAARLQLLRRRVGGFHRLVRHRGADRHGDGDLSRGGGRTKAARAWRDTHASGPPGCGDRGSAPAAAAEGDDGVHRGRQPAPDHVEHERRRRSDEAAGDAGPRRHGVVAAARARHHAGALLLDSRAATRTRARGRGRAATRLPAFAPRSRDGAPRPACREWRGLVAPVTRGGSPLVTARGACREDDSGG